MSLDKEAMLESLKGKQSLTIVAFAMPLSSTAEDGGVLQELSTLDLGMLTGKEMTVPLASLTHEELEGAIQAVVNGLETRVREEIHSFANYYIDAWAAQWEGEQRPFWFPAQAEAEEEPKVEDVKYALVMRASAGSYMECLRSMDDIQGLPDPETRGFSMLMTVPGKEGWLPDSKAIEIAAIKSLPKLKAEFVKYFFGSLKPYLGDERVKQLIGYYQ